MNQKNQKNHTLKELLDQIEEIEVKLMILHDMVNKLIHPPLHSHVKGSVDIPKGGDVTFFDFK